LALDTEHDIDGAAVSHSAELVRGHFSVHGAAKDPLIRPFGPPSPRGEKGCAPAA